MAVNQWDSQAKRLRHSNQGVINCTVSVGVELSHNFAGDTG